jgi:hypothetical protein
MSELEEITIAKRSFAALLLSQVFLLGGCDAPSEVEVDEDAAASVDVASGVEAEDEFRSWTGYTSEENPPLICPYGQGVQGAHCTGSYCDNTSLYCTTTGRSTGWGSWTPYFSEEGSASGHCQGGDMWMTGISCNGSYCDNISLLCSQMSGSSTGSCSWSGWYSEEQGPFYAPWGYFIKGVQCSGRYCDNKRYRYCQLY